MAPLRRFERPTCPLGGGCSIQLSYKGTGRILPPYGLSARIGAMQLNAAAVRGY